MRWILRLVCVAALCVAVAPATLAAGLCSVAGTVCSATSECPSGEVCWKTLEVNINIDKVADYNAFCQSTVLDAVNARRAAKVPPKDPLVTLEPEKCLLAVFVRSYVLELQREANIAVSDDAVTAKAAARQAIDDENPEQVDP